MPMIDAESLAYGGGGVTALVVVGRWFISWIRSQNIKDTNSDKTQELIDRLEAEVKKWEERHNKLFKDHAELADVISELKRRNAVSVLFMRMKGITDEELIAAGIITPEEVRRDGQ